jgi:virulence-associated protein VapD
MKQALFILILSLYLPFHAQVNLTGSLPVLYTQDFGTTDILTWTNNSSITGWYIGSASWNGHLNIPGASLGSPGLNAGGYSQYECNNDNNQKIGSRASGSVPICDYGVVIRNTTGQVITTVEITYTAYQMSVAQNGNVTNTLAVSYQVTNTLSTTPLTSGTFTNATGLDYAAPINSAIGGSATSSALACIINDVKSLCINLPTSIANNDYFILRWRDINDANNDHNIAIDDLTIGFYNQTCAALALPIDDILLTESIKNAAYDLEWASETIEDYKIFKLESSKDGVNYTTVNEGDNAFNKTNVNFDNTYFRVCGIKYNEEEKYSNVVYLDKSKVTGIQPVFKKNDAMMSLSLSNDEAIVDLKIYDLNGMLLFSSDKNQKQIAFALPDSKEQALVFYITPAYHQPIKAKHYFQH